MFQKEYNILFSKTLDKHKIKSLKSPLDAIRVWKKFVDEISKDYDFIPLEFEHDLQNIRPSIELLLTDEILIKQNQHKNFITSIKELDAKFRTLTMENLAWKHLKPRYWFEHRILKKAGSTYANFINSRFEQNHGVKVEIEKNFK